VHCAYKGIIVLKLPSLCVIKYNNGHSVSAGDFVLFCALFLRVVGGGARVVAPVVICFPVERSLAAFARLRCYRGRKGYRPAQTENIQRREVKFGFWSQKKIEERNRACSVYVQLPRQCSRCKIMVIFH